MTCVTTSLLHSVNLAISSERRETFHAHRDHIIPHISHAPGRRDHATRGRTREFFPKSTLFKRFENSETFFYKWLQGVCGRRCQGR